MSSDNPIPPPPNSNKTFSVNSDVMIVALIALFGTAVFLLGLQFYARFCWRPAVTGQSSSAQSDAEETQRGRSRRRPRVRRFGPFLAVDWAREPPAHVENFGLEESVVDSLPTFVYNPATPAGSRDMNSRGSEQSMSCSVCLEEFVEGEKGRVLPKCSHCFHVNCIDMWLHSHTTCPLCRCEVAAGVDLMESLYETITYSMATRGAASYEYPLPSHGSPGNNSDFSLGDDFPAFPTFSTGSGCSHSHGENQREPSSSQFKPSSRSPHGEEEEIYSIRIQEITEERDSSRVQEEAGGTVPDVTGAGHHHETWVQINLPLSARPPSQYPGPSASQQDVPHSPPPPRSSLGRLSTHIRAPQASSPNSYTFGYNPPRNSFNHFQLGGPNSQSPFRTDHHQFREELSVSSGGDGSCSCGSTPRHSYSYYIQTGVDHGVAHQEEPESTIASIAYSVGSSPLHSRGNHLPPGGAIYENYTCGSPIDNQYERDPTIPSNGA